MQPELTREYLIEIAEKSLVRYTNWHDRDSFVAQYNIKFTHAGLSSGLQFEAEINDYGSISVMFVNLTEEECNNANNFLSSSDSLHIDSLSDYLEKYPDREMFNVYDLWFNETDHSCRGYLPTEERLQDADGSDWY